MAPGGFFVMKLSIMDYHQPTAVAYGLNMDDLLLLKWFVDYRNTDGMNLVMIGDEPYYWVNYKKVLEDLPILRINNKDVLRRRLKKLCDAKVLKFHLEKNKKGTFTYYNTGERYLLLLKDFGN